VEVVASLPEGRTAAAQCGLFTHKSVPVIFEPPCIINGKYRNFSHDKTDASVLAKIMLKCNVIAVNLNMNCSYKS